MTLQSFDISFTLKSSSFSLFLSLSIHSFPETKSSFPICASYGLRMLFTSNVRSVFASSIFSLALPRLVVPSTLNVNISHCGRGDDGDGSSTDVVLSADDDDDDPATLSQSPLGLSR